MQLQSRSLAVKARRNANFETAPRFGPHHRSDEIYLAIVVAVFWARQHASQASDLRKDEGKPQFSTAFLDGGGVQTHYELRPSSPRISLYVDKRRFFRGECIF